MPNETNLRWAEQEFLGAILPDQRFRRNLYKMAASLIEQPEFSFTSACGPLVRKAAWRLFSSKELDLGAGHEAATRRRCDSEHTILVVEDTTDLNYWNHKQTEGLGLLGGQKDVLGLSLHSAIALTEAGEPLGIVGEHIWAPTTNGKEKGKLKDIDISKKESYKWLLALNWTKKIFEGFGGTVIMVGDREADIYEHFSAQRPEHIQLLVRARDLRRKVYLENKPFKVKDLPHQMPLKGTLEVVLRRKKNRKERTAKLEVRSSRVTCPAPAGKKGASQALWVIHAKEVGYQDGVDPIEWYLFSTMPIESMDDAVCFIGYYVKRWIIERLHYILKQGLRIERLQFDNFTRLSNAIQLYLIIGWYLLRLLYMGKATPDQSAIDYFDPLDIKLVQQITSKKIQTVKQFLIALSSLAGFVPSIKQPLPGEKLLWQSMRTLLAIRRGFLLAKDMGLE